MRAIGVANDSERSWRGSKRIDMRAPRRLGESGAVLAASARRHNRPARAVYRRQAGPSRPKADALLGWLKEELGA